MDGPLREKSIHQLRGIAQSFGIKDIFEKDAVILAQEIGLKQQELIPPPVVLPPKPEYDARLMSGIPSLQSDKNEIIEIIEPFIKIGLHLRFDEENWYMSHGIKNDSGTIRMPLRNILVCAERLMR